MVYPEVYAGGLVLLSSGAALWFRRRNHLRLAALGAATAWLATIGFLSDHLENIFLWQELSRARIPTWLPKITYVFNRLKLGGDYLAVLGTVVAGAAMLVLVVA